MKKFKKIFLMMCLFVPLAFTACKSDNASLSTPKIVEIKGGTIVFNKVANAEYYTISINGNEIVVNPYHSTYVDVVGNKVKYDASKIFTVGNNYSVQVKANNSKKSGSYSTVYSYKHSGSIKKPTNVRINSTTLTWDSVNNASYYTVKILTPTDKVIFDNDGKLMSAITPSTISNADVTEYYFNTNSFDFASLLNHAGKYEFYVCAVIADGTYYVESDYTESISYINNVELSAPINGEIHEIDGELHLMTILDPNTNAISVTCDNIEKTAEINGSELSLKKLSDNVVDINLTKFFSSFVEAGNLNLDNYKTYTFTTQCKYLAQDAKDSFYLDSKVSNDVMFENTYQLATPSIEIEEKEDGTHLVSWSSEESDLVSAYKLIVCMPNEVKEYPFDLSVNNMLMPENFIAASVQAVGKGNCISSTFSEFVYPISEENEQEFQAVVNGSTLSWPFVRDSYSILIMGNEYSVITDYSYTFTAKDFKSNELTTRFYHFESGYRFTSSKFTFECSETLAKPTFGYGQGFKSSNIYELTFTGSENAIGYYVYIKGSGSNDYVRLNTLYTTTTIDLSEYIITEGNYTNYQVKVKAVADVNSVYNDSSLSDSVSVSHIQVLDNPEFFKVNGVSTPIIKQVSANTAKYTLQFYGVENAGSYELLINYNRLMVEAVEGTEVYSIDVTNYLTAANNYEIRVKAIPFDAATNVVASDYSVTHYLISRQLAMVTNVKVIENEGIYTLSFDPVDNAESYMVRIMKENDSGYVDYLNSLNLHNLINVKNSLDVTEYVQKRGVYYFYVTALAPTTNSYYSDANESLDYATLDKLTTLKTPTDIGYDNASKDTYLLYWTGDENADYYRIRLTDPNGVIHEFNSFVDSVNINQYMTIQGDYSVAIYSMVNAKGENAKEYASSAATDFGWRYLYTTEKDFLRYSVLMFGSGYNFVANTADGLKNLLWNHYLFGTGVEGLSLMVRYEDITLKEKIIKLSIEATQLNLYDFTGTNDLETITNYFEHIDKSKGDTTWYSMIGEENSSNLELFRYLCERLLETYPDLNVLTNFNIDTISTSSTETIYNLRYENALNTTKLDVAENTKALKNYGSAYNYIDLNARKSATGAFAIDNRPEALVTTTEQLLQIVQHNMKPKFLGNSATAEQVYNNAKLVLSAIVTKNMTELEKVTAIFDWLEANYDLTYYMIESSTYLSGALEKEDVANYGRYKNYYLEGIFEDITMAENGDLIIGSNLATSWSYSKAFALLCAIEGIDAKVIYGSYDFHDTHTANTATAEHVWNKVCLSTTATANARNVGTKEWYVVDLTLSDNRIYFNDLNKGYGMSSHSHFLVTDSFVQENTYLDIQLSEKTYLISNKYQSDLICTNSYDYYGNSSFGLTYTQIDQTILDFDTGSVKGFNYSKLYTPEPQDASEESQQYQRYAKTLGYGSLQSYLLNAMIYSEYMADHNPSKRSTFEFTFKRSDNGNSYIFNRDELFERFETDTTKYNIQLKLIPELADQFYTVINPTAGTTTVIFIVEKTA